jgi:hypothetical protein
LLAMFEQGGVLRHPFAQVGKYPELLGIRHAMCNSHCLL